MSTDSIAWRVVPDFEAFILATPPEAFGARQPTCLADFIRLWMEEGDGVRRCLGDYQTYLIGVIAIIDKWSHEPSLLDHVAPSGKAGVSRVYERRVTEVLPDSRAGDILDPDFFAACAYNYGQRRNHEQDSQ